MARKETTAPAEETAQETAGMAAGSYEHEELDISLSDSVREAAAAAEPEEDENDLGEGAISEENPYGWGEGTTPPGRVRFLRFLVWSTSPNRLVSLRDKEGELLAPGYMAAMQATRPASVVMDGLRQQARQQGIQLYIQSLFVPVVYPDVVPFRFWQHTTNPFDHTLVSLHYLHKKILEKQVRGHFARAIPKDKRFVMSDLSNLLLQNRIAFDEFFSNPANSQCRGIVWRDQATRILGQGCPQFSRIVCYAVLRPEWIVDAQPVFGAKDLIGKDRRKDPEACYNKVQKILVCTEAGLKSLPAEKR